MLISVLDSGNGEKNGNDNGYENVRKVAIEQVKVLAKLNKDA